LYVDEGGPDLHEINATTRTPLNSVPYGKLCPGAAALSAIQRNYR
jgi:hypothetical protein